MPVTHSFFYLSYKSINYIDVGTIAVLLIIESFEEVESRIRILLKVLCCY